MTTTAQLEREAEETRSQIADTLQELRTRMTPGEVVDQLFDYARDGGGGMFLRNLGQQVTDNPIPVALMGAGLAWLMMGGRGPSARSLSEASRRVRNTMSDTGEWMAEAGRGASEAVAQKGRLAEGRASGALGEMADKTRSTAEDWAKQTREMASNAGEKARRATSRVGEVASSASASVKDAVSSTYESTSEEASRAAAAVRNTAASMRDNATMASRSMLDFFQEQPIALTGIGLALGAVIGAVLPSTEAEDRLMGETSDDVKDTAREVATEQVEKASAVAEHAVDEAKQQAEKQGLGSREERFGSEQHGASGSDDVQSHAEREATLVRGGDGNTGPQTDQVGIPEDIRGRD